MKITVEFSVLRLSNALLLVSVEVASVECEFIMWLWNEFANFASRTT